MQALHDGAGVRAGRLHPPRPEAVRGVPQAAGRRSRAAARCARARHAQPGACSSARTCEKFNLFFLEDPLSPEDIAYFRQIRQQCATPIAMGELFNSPHEWTPLIAERLIDYIRMHVSQAGGLTPCRKIAAMGEIFGVRTAWHGPGDVSPVGHTANVRARPGQLQLRHPGILAASTTARAKSSTGCPVMKDGYLYANEAPGWGIEIDEKAAAKYPFRFGAGRR